jgi:hypothetical protein
VLRWDQGRLDEIDGAVPTHPLIAAWTSVVAAAAAAHPGVDDALAAEVRRPEPVVWTSHGRLALLAHAVADRGLTALVETLERQLAPLAGYLATLARSGRWGRSPTRSPGSPASAVITPPPRRTSRTPEPRPGGRVG